MTVRTLDVVVDKGRRSPRAPLRTAAGVLDRARAAVGLDDVGTRSPIPAWEGASPDQPMWESDRQKRDKHRAAQGIETPGGPPSDEVPATPKAPIELYFTRGCPYTRAAMGLLDEREIPYEAIDVSDDEVQRSWVKLVTGRDTTPQVFIWGEPIGGFDQLRELEQSGELRERVGRPSEGAQAPDKPVRGRVKLPVLHPERSPFEALGDFGLDAEADDEELEGDALIARVEQVLDDCRPMVQADGGDIVLLDVSHDRVTIELTGNCIGCPSAQATLEQGIERRLKARIPQIRSISSPQLQ